MLADIWYATNIVVADGAVYSRVSLYAAVGNFVGGFMGICARAWWLVAVIRSARIVHARGLDPYGVMHLNRYSLPWSVWLFNALALAIGFAASALSGYGLSMDVDDGNGWPILVIKFLMCLDNASDWWKQRPWSLLPKLHDSNVGGSTLLLASSSVNRST